MLRVPTATYRLQFNSEFTFRDATKILPYLAALGITDVYSSPLLRPRHGSTHGYDIVDATILNPALGSDEDFSAFQEELDRHGMGLLLDIVPNHMAASHENEWWTNVLENGPQSRYLHYFDIDWRPVTTGFGVEEKVLLPILGKPYGESLESKEIQLGFDENGLYFSYYDKRLPVAPRSYHIVLRECLETLPEEGPGIEIRDIVQNDEVIANSRFLKNTLWRIYQHSAEFREALEQAIARLNGTPGDQESFNHLDGLLDAQWYRLAYWRIASETINYRRFFDITDLVGLKIENPEVFELRNQLIFNLIAKGRVTGLRVDHIDGLFDPMTYLMKLQLRLGDPDTEELEQFYVVVEKILEHGEHLPDSFRCSGTTGYDFLDAANTLFVDPPWLDTLSAFYGTFTQSGASWDDIVYDRKKQVIDQLFSGEMRALGQHLGVLAIADRNARDFAPSELLSALIEITACMPVYRTYVRGDQVTAADRESIRQALAKARSRARYVVDERLFNFLELVLLLEPPDYIAAERDRWAEFVMRWQQFTGRVMAKGVEDTAFYNYNRLISLNEVGGEPGRTGDVDPVAELHERNDRIARDWPHTMNATSTHDTKRSEDVRARISVLSEMPDIWRREVSRWQRMNASLKHGGVPHPNEELLIYQTLVGFWPLVSSEIESVPGRLAQFLQKAAREAKTHSSWLSPDTEYENALQNFAAGILDNEPFRKAFLRFQKKIAFHGFLNSLAQVVLRITCPGVPDTYQGAEMWDLSLVDPDNRRPVDYQALARRLKTLPAPSTLLRRWSDGRIKLFATSRALAARAKQIGVFTSGAYRAVETPLPNAFAFTRGDDEALVVVPRLTTRLVRAPRLPLGDVWGEHLLPIDGRWRNQFTDEVVEGESLPLREIFATFPVAIFSRE
jgi:(1->4)-alpha-D-glucan 1-alpha-D-glucosylmutase